jgi:dihydrofolate reductase
MGKIIISENISLDGVIQDPTGEDADGLGRGSWFGCIGDADRAEWAAVEYEEALAAAALLMGRRSYTWFLARGWASRTGGWADRLRALPKYVVTASPLDDPGWVNSTALTGDVVEEVTKLADRTDGDVVVYGSGRLTRTLLAHDLVAELRLMTYPVVVGAGHRLFGGTSTAARPMRLVETRPVGTALARLTYQPVPSAGAS